MPHPTPDDEPDGVDVPPSADQLADGTSNDDEAAGCSAPAGDAEKPPSPKGRRRSAAQRRASQENGRKSNGPGTSDGKAKTSQNAITHGGYAKRPVIQRGVFREDPREYDREREAFLAVLKPVNHLAQAHAIRLFHEYRKLDRTDHFEVEALGHAGLRPPPKPYKEAFALASARLNAAEADLDYWEGVDDKVHEGPDNLRWFDWVALCGLAEDGTLEGLQVQMTDADGNPAAQAEMLPAVQSGIESALTAQAGSIGRAVRTQIAKARLTVSQYLRELEALEEPLTKSEYGAKVAYLLIDGGFFDRLARPRATIYKAIQQAWDQFHLCQELGPDAIDDAGTTNSL